VIPPPPPGVIIPREGGKPVAAAVEVQQTVMTKLSIADPIFTDQWHLFNTVQVGHDVNVTGVWLEGITGRNATVAIIDDGLDMNSLDLKDNYFAEGSYDFNEGHAVPAPVDLDRDRHGTRCAGEVAAVRNDVCGIGVAYDSKIAGIRILGKAISDADEAEAMMFKYDKNQIYSCSWGPRDDGRTMEAPAVLIRRAMLKSIQEGRDGLGSIYVFASGNGAASDDNCNFDGYTNSIYSITVGAVDRAGKHPYYSEHCSAQLVVTYSSGDGDSIVGIPIARASYTQSSS
jgi:kexin